MGKFVAIIKYAEGTGVEPEIVEIGDHDDDSILCINDAWNHLIMSRWSDYDPWMGGLEDPRRAVKNCCDEAIESVRMLHVMTEDNSYFNVWYETACEAYERAEAMKTEEGERAYLAKLKVKYEPEGDSVSTQ